MSIIDYVEISFIEGIGKRTVKALQEKFGSISTVLNNPEVVREEFGEALFYKIANRSPSFREKALKEVEKAENLGINSITIEDKNFPPLLREIPDSPLFLFYKGSLLPEIPLISIVGSRKHSVYGKSIATKICEYLVENGIGIVSGMASGIDAVVHSVCVEKGGYTVGILGCGIDQIFPPENRKLYEKVENKGCLISEFFVGIKPSKYTFPIRNRIIAGISYGTIVVEAREKSGALITARYANDYGRIVFSVPSNINNPYGKGSNILIKEGAIPIIDINDILEHIPFLKNHNIKRDFNLSTVEKDILNIISHPVHIDVIAEKTGLSVDKLSVILFDMEIKGLITLEGGIVVRNL